MAKLWTLPFANCGNLESARAIPRIASLSYIIFITPKYLLYLYRQVDFKASKRL